MFRQSIKNILMYIFGDFSASYPLKITLFLKACKMAIEAIRDAQGMQISYQYSGLANTSCCGTNVKPEERSTENMGIRKAYAKLS